MRLIRDIENRNRWHIPIIALTAEPLMADRKRDVTDGMVHLLSKAFKRQQWAETLQR